MSDRVILFQVRVMFKFKDKDVINFKILTDTENGIKEFIERLKTVEGIEHISVEYLSEYDVSKLGQIINICGIGGDVDEKSDSED